MELFITHICVTAEGEDAQTAITQVTSPEGEK